MMWSVGKPFGLYHVGSGNLAEFFCCCLFVCFVFLDSVDEQIWISDIFLELWRTIRRVKILKGKIKIKNKSVRRLLPQSSSEELVQTRGVAVAVGGRDRKDSSKRKKCYLWETRMFSLEKRIHTQGFEVETFCLVLKWSWILFLFPCLS